MRTRYGVRLIVINHRDEILLIKAEDAVSVIPDQPDMLIYWVTPGGGLEGAESYEDAAKRELWEETGITDQEIGTWIWTREGAVVIQDEYVRKHERYHLVRVDDPAVGFDNIEEAERPVFRDIRWWSLADLRASSETIRPLDWLMCSNRFSMVMFLTNH